MNILDNFNEGDAVTVSYDINGREFEDPNTHEVKYFNTIRGYKIEPYGRTEEVQAPTSNTVTQHPPVNQETIKEKDDLPF